MKFRYLVFTTFQYYPAGGMFDCKLKTDKYFDCIECLINDSFFDYCHIYDCKTGETIIVTNVKEEWGRVNSIHYMEPE